MTGLSALRQQYYLGVGDSRKNKLVPHNWMTRLASKDKKDSDSLDSEEEDETTSMPIPPIALVSREEEIATSTEQLIIHLFPMPKTS